VLGDPLDVSIKECSRAAEAVLLELLPLHQGENAISRHPEALGGLVDGDPKPNWCGQSHSSHSRIIASRSSVGNTLDLAIHRRRHPV
jgi:hypothetical protein